MDDVTFVNGRYRVLQEGGPGPLGGHLAGPLAEVIRARDLESGHKVAIKRFRPHFSRDARFAVRFREQLKRLAPVTHPALVSIVDYGFDGECFFIASEWVDGVNLSTYLAEYGSLGNVGETRHRGGVAFSPEAAVYVARQVCAALGALHGAGLVHRGLKPENVFITSERGSVKVSDATLSRLASESGLSRTNVMMGSVAYMSPEQARGKPVGPQADIYSLGVILFEMLTDELPFKASDPWSLVSMHAQDAPPSPRERNRAVSPELASIVERALQKAPEERFATVESLEAALAPLPQGDDLLWLVAPRAGGRSQGKRQFLETAFKQRWNSEKGRQAKNWSRVRETVGQKMRPRVEGAYVRLRDSVERRARPLLERRRTLTFGQRLLLSFTLTFVIAFLLIHLLSGAVTGTQETGALGAMDDQGARRAEIRKVVQTSAPVQTPTLAPTGSLVEETATATAQPTEPAPTVQAVQENGAGNGAPQDGGPPPHAGGPPPHAGPPGGPPGHSGDKPGRGRGRR